MVAKTMLPYDMCMSFTRITGHAIVIAYLVIITLGAAHAVRRLSPVPFSRVTIFMYGMLAPYQGYSEVAEGYMAEGFVDGAWRTIDLAPFYPVLPGERSMRERHTYMNWAHFGSSDAAYRAYAERIQSLEAARGNTYDRMRLSWVQWRPTVEAYRVSSDDLLQTRFLVTVP